ncbi:hypothetical protein TD95_003868 [Thielaviopsis punctulata]|uniref:Defective in cullin neddylation protein n=1 Tax=Thielaviopsis punctulata TaxID=72032 RepID=A0A0F4ZKB0_9PEZI|nr:hypothetical protein TD95_003868 [Thielaviopsis punctulata]
MPTAALVRAMTVQFQQITGASERTAQRFLRSADYNFNAALNAFLSNNNQPAHNPLDAPLNALFDSLIGPNDSNDAIDIESSMAYLTDKLDVNLENAEMFVAMWVLQAPSIGKITRKGFVEGWKSTGVNSSSHDTHAAFIKQKTAALATDPDLFKQVYRNAFLVGKEPDQKALALDNALIYWNLLFSPPGWPWKTAAHDWAALWAEFLTANHKRSVNRDMWNQTLEFARRSVKDESLSFWSEDGAWPGVVDDFVAWFYSKFGGGGRDKRGGSDAEMD